MRDLPSASPFASAARELDQVRALLRLGVGERAEELHDLGGDLGVARIGQHPAQAMQVVRARQER